VEDCGWREGIRAVVVTGKIKRPPGVGLAGGAAFQVAVFGGPGVDEPRGGGVVIGVAGGMVARSRARPASKAAAQPAASSLAGTSADTLSCRSSL
jgi:hypothetical protein